MNRLLIFIVTAFAGIATVGAQPIMLDKVIAVVGDRAVLLSDVEEQYRFLQTQNPGMPEDAKGFVLEQVISQELLIVQADRDSLVVSEDEVNQQLDARIDQIMQYMGNDMEQFMNYYGESPIQVKEKFREPIEAQLTAQKMQQALMGKVKVSPAETKAYFRKIPKDSLPYFNAEVEIAEIVIKPKVSEAEDKEARDLAAELRRRIVEDKEDFAELASKYSADPGSARNGGELGWVSRGSFVPEFEAAAYRMQDGEFSEIVKTDFGYHLIQLLERRGNQINTRHILIKPRINREDMDLAAQRLDSIRTLIITDSFSFSQAVQKFSEADQSKDYGGRILNPTNGGITFETGDLPIDIYFAIDTLSQGSVSAPVEFQTQQGETAYRIVNILDQTEPHQANLKDDWSKIETAALEQKKMMYMEEWVEKTAAKTYIYVAPEFRNYEVIQRYLKN